MTVRTLLLLAALHAALAAAILFAGMAAGRAAPIGRRIAVEACRASACRPLPASARRRPARYARQARARQVAAFADRARLLPAGVRIEARCLPVAGMPGA